MSTSATGRRSSPTSSPRQFLLTRPLLEAIRADEPVVLLIDEVDRVEIETEALLLEVLSDFQVSIPELGTIVGKQRPLVFLTSNNTRELSEALKRRCLFLHIDYPDVEREKEIVRVRVPEVDDALADADREGRRLDPQHRPEEGAVDLGDDRLGAHARVPRSQRDHARSDGRDAARAAQVPDRHHQGAQGARRRRARRRSSGSACVTCNGASSTTRCGSAGATRSDDVTRAADEPHMLDVLQGFVHELRAAGLPVSMTENLDAMRAVEYVPLDDRDAFKAALGATLVKHHGHYKVFDTVFEVYFSIFSPGRRTPTAKPTSTPTRRPTSTSSAPRWTAAARWASCRNEELAQMLLDALMRMDQSEMRAARGRGGGALRGHGAGPSGRRRVLPLPHAAAARRRRPRRPR